MTETIMGNTGRGLRKGPLLEKILHPAAASMIRVACEELLPDGNARLLELLPGPVNVMPGGDEPNVVTGLGGRLEDLSRNEGLRHRILADLNEEPVLPFRSDCFDGAVFFFGVETLLTPDTVFEEVSRVLKPGAVFLIVYSPVTDSAYCNSRWKLMDEQERLSTIVSSFEKAKSFGPVTAYGTKKRFRSDASKKQHPAKDLAHVWIAYAKNRSGEARGRELSTPLERPYEEEANPLQCPYCGDRLRKYEVPHSAYEIDYWYEADYLYICFNDGCPYFERGWEWMWSKMRRNVSYRHMYNPTTHKSGPIPVPTNYALRDGIVDDI
jgi:SAM-dependent methyltransferase